MPKMSLATLEAFANLENHLRERVSPKIIPHRSKPAPGSRAATPRSFTQSALRKAVNYNPETGAFTHSTYDSPAYETPTPIGSWTDGYLFIRIDGIQYPAAKLAVFYMTGEYPDTFCVDHQDHNPSNNRFSNLKPSTRLENMRNQKLSNASTSGLPGVQYILNSRWLATIGKDGKSIRLGQFDNLFDAACARKSAEAHLGFHPNHGKR